jgi:hypothetical protein
MAVLSPWQEFQLEQQRMDEIFIGLGANGERQTLRLGRANRHGLIAGATGTGKTVTLQTIAEQFSAAGVPVFLADVKGDLSPASRWPAARFQERREARRRGPRKSASPIMPIRDNPAVFWDLYGEQGHPIRTTISEMGPLLLARLMGLNETQEGVLNIAFRYADDQGLLLLDLPDLQAVLIACAENASELGHHLRQCLEGQRRHDPAPAAGVRKPGRGPLSLASRRSRSTISSAVTKTASGIINMLAADKLMQAPSSTPPSCCGCWPNCSSAARSRRSGKAQAGVLLRRSAPAVRRCARGAARQGRAGRPADPFKGRGRLFHHAEPDRHSRERSPASSATACSTRCAPSPRATRRRSRRRPKPSASTPISTSKPRSPS